MKRSYSLSCHQILGLMMFAIAALSVLLPLSLFAEARDLYVTNLATNTVDVYTPDGTKSVFASGFISPQGLVFDPDHNLYVADAGNGTIYKYDTAGTRTTFLSSLSTPTGLALRSHNLLVAESGLNRVVTIPIPQGRPKVFIDEPLSILDVAADENAVFITYKRALAGFKIDGGTLQGWVWSFPPANTKGVAAFLRRSDGDYFEFVTLDNGQIWMVQWGFDFERQRVFASGLNDPNGIVIKGHDPSGVYVADRGTGEILEYTLEGERSVFISDAGIPNFLAVEPEP